jgi:hypothetical protein
VGRQGQGLHETHPLVAAGLHPAVRQRPADAPKEKNVKVTLVYQHELTERPRQGHQGRACRMRPGRSGQIFDINVERGGDLLYVNTVPLSSPFSICDR